MFIILYYIFRRFDAVFEVQRLWARDSTNTTTNTAVNNMVNVNSIHNNIDTTPVASPLLPYTTNFATSSSPLRSLALSQDRASASNNNDTATTSDPFTVPPSAAAMINDVNNGNNTNWLLMPYLTDVEPCMRCGQMFSTGG